MYKVRGLGGRPSKSFLAVLSPKNFQLAGTKHTGSRSPLGLGLITSGVVSVGMEAAGFGWLRPAGGLGTEGTEAIIRVSTRDFSHLTLVCAVSVRVWGGVGQFLAQN